MSETQGFKSNICRGGFQSPRHIACWAFYWFGVVKGLAIGFARVASSFASIAAPSFEVLLIIQRKRKVQIVTKVMNSGALRALFGEIGRCESNRLSWIPYRPFVTWGYLFAQKSLLGFMPPNSQLLSLLSKLFYAGGFYLMSFRTAVRRFMSTSFGRASRSGRSACLGCVRSEPTLNCGGLISAAACLGRSLCFFLF